MSNLGKYESAHPLRRLLLNRFLRRARILAPGPDHNVLDVGTGEGMFWRESQPPVLAGVDLRHEALEAAVREIGLLPAVADATQLPYAAATFDLVTAIEVLEHLPNPEAALDEIRRVTKGRIVISTPWEPWFSLATLVGGGRHFRRLGREEEHIQAFGPRDHRRMLEQRFSDVRVTTVFPWILSEAHVDRGGLNRSSESQS